MLTYLILYFVTAFITSFLFFPVLIKLLRQWRLFDSPGSHKIHKGFKPSMGGIGIFIGFAIASLIWLDFDQWANMRYVHASLFVLFLLGVRDDIVPLRPLHKLIGQIAAIIILMGSSIQISSLNGFLGINELPLILSYTLTIFTIVIITNSFNLIDGLDGLAGSVGFIALTSFGIWFYCAGDVVFAPYCFAMAGGILAFLIFNWEPSKIFMGDTGTMVIGMFLAVLTIQFMKVNESLPIDHPAKFKATIAAAVCFIIIPLSDTLRIIILRLLKGQSPFTPDKSHIHHAIMRLGMTHSKTTLILASVHILFIVSIILFRHWSEVYTLTGIILLAIVLTFILDRMIQKKLSRKIPNK